MNMASSSTTHQHYSLIPTPYATTAAPPPTPSETRPNIIIPDALFNLLPPTLSLSLPTRRSTTVNPPLISLNDPALMISAATQLGYFHLTYHQPIPFSAAVSLFDLPLDTKQVIIPNNWPFGYEDIDDNDVSSGESFCLSPNDLLLGLDSSNFLMEFGRDMERIGLKVVEELGFVNPIGDHKLCSQLWISNSDKPGRVYPYVVGLHCQLMQCGKCSLWTDSGWVNVSGPVDSVLVTLGDIAQVWSNGKLKKVIGRPVPIISSEDENKLNSHCNCITMSLLITLPLESTVSPYLLPSLAPNRIICIDEQENDNETNDIYTSLKINEEQRHFRSFSFEDYAWRVYHQRLLHKDPLLRYKI